MSAEAVPTGGRLLLAYALPDGTRIWILTLDTDAGY